MGSYDQGAALSLSPRRPEELGSPPGWYRHSHPEGAVFYPENFTSDTVRGRDGDGMGVGGDKDGDRDGDKGWGQRWVRGTSILTGPRERRAGLWGTAGADPSTHPARALRHHPPSLRPSPGADGCPPRAGQQQLQPGERALRLAQHHTAGAGDQGGEGEHPAEGQRSLPHPGTGEGRGKPDPPPTPNASPSSLKASRKPGCSTGPRRWTEGSGSGKRVPVSPAAGEGSSGGRRGRGLRCPPA